MKLSREQIGISDLVLGHALSKLIKKTRRYERCDEPLKTQARGNSLILDYVGRRVVVLITKLPAEPLEEQ